MRIAALLCTSWSQIWIPEIEYYQKVSSHAQIRPQGAENQQMKVFVVVVVVWSDHRDEGFWSKFFIFLSSIKLWPCQFTTKVGWWGSLFCHNWVDTGDRSWTKQPKFLHLGSGVSQLGVVKYLNFSQILRVCLVTTWDTSDTFRYPPIHRLFWNSLLHVKFDFYLNFCMQL